MRREWLRLCIGISGLVALGVGVRIYAFGIVFPPLAPRVDIVVADVLQTVYIVGDVVLDATDPPRVGARLGHSS
jgi:hypothetical protein